MSKPVIGKSIRRLRMEQGFSQQGLAQKLGISTSYLNLVEHDQRGVTASLLFKLTDILKVDLAALSGVQERQFEVGLREVFSDPLLNLDPVPEEEIRALAASAPNGARAVMALHRALAAAREDGNGITLPSGRKIMLPNEEVRDFFHDHANYFPELENAAETISRSLDPLQGTNHALAERLRRAHGLVVLVQALPGHLRVYEAEARLLRLSESLPRESRGFQMAFQLALLEARDNIEPIVEAAALSSRDARELLRIGLLNYIAGAILMPYESFLSAAHEFRYNVDELTGRFGVSYEQACHRLSTLQRGGGRGVPLFFLRIDPAGNVSKRFSAAGFPFGRLGGTCPRWIVHAAFSTPDTTRVQVSQLPDGATFLCFARAVTGRAVRWGDPAPVHVVAMGCDISHGGELVYSDGIDLGAAAVGIGLSCRICERHNCRSRAFPPIAHRLTVDPRTTSASPYQFEARES